MSDPVWVDTWGWVARANRRDAPYRNVSTYWTKIEADGTRLYTSDYVVNELIGLLFRRVPFAKAVKFVEDMLESEAQGRLTIEQITTWRFTAAWELRKRFRDKPTISFTDLTSMAVMQELGIAHVLTEDEHFLHVGLGFHKVP
jgi:predicted nucleic acid-binding protein